MKGQAGRHKGNWRIASSLVRVVPPLSLVCFPEYSLSSALLLCRNPRFTIAAHFFTIALLCFRLPCKRCFAMMQTLLLRKKHCCRGQTLVLREKNCCCNETGRQNQEVPRRESTRTGESAIYHNAQVPNLAVSMIGWHTRDHVLWSACVAVYQK